MSGQFNERVAKVAVDLIDTVQDRLAAHKVTHSEYRAAWEFAIRLAESGELPLFLDVFFEAAVERASFGGLPGSEGTVEGPYHLDDHQVLEAPYRMPMRPDEPGEPFLFTGKVTDLDGRPLSGVTVDAWHAGNDGTYSGFNPAAPHGNLRGIMTTDSEGTVRFASVRPAPYQIPHSGPTGEFLLKIGRHAWRPAHFHFILSKDGYEPLTTQIYFRGDDIISGQGDIVEAVKDSLIIGVGSGADPAVAATYGLPACYQTGEYAWALRPAS
jgi:catechol 1,2-dioxygenase